MTAKDYFDDGNRLFRDDLYYAALLRYRQANESGLDTPLLHYNMGVAYYRAQQYIRARDSLLKALESPTLKFGAQYSLGLNAYALGDNDEALRWFRLARDQNQNEKLANYARLAISRIHAQQTVPDPVLVRAAEKRAKREVSHLELRARVSFGTDDNVFRTPSEPYVDFSDPTTPTVTPEVRSGAFMPVDMSARYFINAYEYEGFFGAYRLAGRYYQDKELENGNEFSHELSFGNQYRRRDEEAGREREVYSAFKVAQHDEVYYDPDNGGSRVINGVSIDDRMNYLRYGPELAFRQSHEHLSVGAVMKGQLWNYENVVEVPEYDHEYFLFGLTTQYRFAPTSLLRLNINKYTRRFGERPSFELDGTQQIGAPPVRYDYLDIALVARQRVFDSFWFGINYQRTDRQDRHVGYNDYVRDSYGIDIHWGIGDRLNIDAAGFYRLYDFANAFAFNNPAVGRKTLETADVRLTASYRMTLSLSLVLEARLREKVSNDTRIAYDRNQFVLGVRWEPR
jgi:tetratricopeptide (TPR) repeat protein